MKLPNGNVIDAEFPKAYWLHSGGRDDGYDYIEKKGQEWRVSDASGNLIQTKSLSEYQNSDRNDKKPALEDFITKPVFYKGNLFADTNGKAVHINPETMEVIGTVENPSYYPYEVDNKTLFETSGGYEITEGNFIKADDMHYMNSEIFSDGQSSYFYYSHDGIYYIKVSKPYQKLAYYTRCNVNGDNSLVLKSDDVYNAYSISSLRECWNEYTKNSPYVKVNGVCLAFDRPPVIKDGYTLMPLRFLLETVGAEVA